jgi:hypothetical protein
MRRTRRQTRKIKSFASGTAPPVPSAPHSGEDAPSYAADAISVSNLSLHELFEQQARNMLESADIDEEQRQSILVAMACPCCGAGGMSFSVKLKSGSTDGA